MSHQQLPNGWATARLGDLADVQLGKMLDSKRTVGRPLEYLRNVNVRWGRVDTSDLLRMPFVDDELERYGVRSGDVLVCEGGEPGRAAVWLGSTSLKYQKALHRVRFGKGVRGQWLVYSLLLETARSGLRRRFTGSTIAHLPREVFLEYVIRVAPTSEQERILEALDSHLSRLDDAVANLERVQRNLTRYRASVLKAAVEGRLVPTEAELARAQGRSYEPASVLLDRILAERRRRWEDAELARLTAAGKPPKNDAWKSKYAEPAPLDTADLPQLPEGWCWASAYQCSQIQAGVGFPERLQGRTAGDYPFFKVGDISRAFQRGERELRTANHYVTEMDLGDLHARPIRQSATVFAKIGAAIALNRRAMLAQPSLVDNNCYAVLPDESAVEPTFMFYFLCTVSFGESSRATTVPSLRLDDVGLVPVPLPPRAEQLRIINALDIALTSIGSTRKDVGRQLAHCARLRQSILKWAFEGKLVDQDPDDEPASVLVERIRAERAASQASRPRGTRVRRRASERTHLS